MLILPFTSHRIRSISLLLFVLLSPSSNIIAQSLEVGAVTTHNTSANPTFNTFNFTAIFATPPVVIPIASQTGGHSCATDVKNVTTAGFDVACTEPPKWDGPHAAMSVHYIAIEPGVHKFSTTSGGSVTIAAGCTTTDTVQHNCAGCGATGWDSLNFGHTFATPPAVLTHVRTSFSETGAVPNNPSVPFLTSVVRGGSITTTGFDAAIERSEVPGGAGVKEELCWIAMEENKCDTIEYGSTGNTIDFMVRNTGEVVDGWSDGCNAGEGLDFNGCFTSTPVVTAAKISRNERDGGWPRRCFLNSGEVRFTIDEDTATDGERNHVREELSVFAFEKSFATTPISLSYVRFDRTTDPTTGADGVTASWRTATETANAGFKLYVKRGDSYEPATESLIPSQAIDSTEPLSYDYFIADSAASQFMIADVDLQGREQRYGPYTIGHHYGTTTSPRRIDWSAKRASIDSSDATIRSPLASGDEVSVIVDKTGVFRVGYEDLLSAGFTVQGASIHDVALTLDDIGVRRRLISSDRVFGPGDSIEFVGEAINDSLYTDKRIYRISIDREKVVRMPRVVNEIPNDTPPNWFMAKQRLAADNRYGFSSPSGDPWYMDRLVSVGSPSIRDYSFDLPGLVANANATPTLRVNLWGLSRWPITPDHHYLIRVNDQQVADRTFDGPVESSTQHTLTMAQLGTAPSKVTVEVPGDTGATHDIVVVDAVEIRYPREFRLVDGSLAFYARSAAFKVTGLESTRAVVYRARQGQFDQPERVAGLQVTNTGSDHTLRFAGNNSRKLRYFVVEPDKIMTPQVKPATPKASMPIGKVDFLIVSHPSFLDTLAPFIQARELQGLAVHLTNVDSIYSRYSSDIVNPTAIRDYITDLKRDHGLKYVLLVGGDTYDYHDNLGLGSVSYIPSPYAKTGSIVNYAPADTLLTDTDRDGLGDLPIGRWPVRTTIELERVINKTLRYDASTNTKDAFFVADGSEDEFNVMSLDLTEAMPDDWLSQTIVSTAANVSQARTDTLAALNLGPRLASFFGHSAPSQWTFNGLFSAADVNALTNTEPFVLTQAGCWNTYHVDPQYDTMGHAFLLDSDAGAVAVLGASTLAYANTEHAFSRLIMERIAKPGRRLGDAVKAARDKMSDVRSDALDVLLGWSLLGDPTIVVNPE